MHLKFVNSLHFFLVLSHFEWCKYAKCKEFDVYARLHVWMFDSLFLSLYFVPMMRRMCTSKICVLFSFLSHEIVVQRKKSSMINFLSNIYVRLCADLSHKFMRWKEFYYCHFKFDFVFVHAVIECILFCERLNF